MIFTGGERVDLVAALEQLNAQFAIHTVRIDSGGKLNGALLQAGLVDEVSVLLCGSLAGPTAGWAFSSPEMTGTLYPFRLKLFHCEKVQENAVWLRYEVEK